MNKSKVDFDFRGWGGDLMSEQGVNVVKHYRELAFMGFAEVIANLRTILGNIKRCKEDILNFKPDFVILVDYPGFNMRIAEFCKKQVIPVVYYISPQVWAWKKNRVYKLRRDVDLMLTILPFEKDFYKEYSFDVDYVGHPLLDAITPAPEEGDYLALLPGSRKQEIEKILPVMNEVALKHPEQKFILAQAPSQEEGFYKQIISSNNISLSKEGTSKVLNGARLALVTSGTATLETALYNVPQVVCYKGNRLSYQIAKRIVDIKYISLVNLIMDREVVKELIQDDLNVENLNNEMLKIMPGQIKRSSMMREYKGLKEILGGSGASDRASQRILEFFQL